MSKNLVFRRPPPVIFARRRIASKRKLQGAEQTVQVFRETHNAVSLEDKQNIIVEKLKDLNLKVDDAKRERLTLEADVTTIKQGKAKTAE